MVTLEQENERLREEIKTLEFALFWTENPIDALVPKTKASDEYVQSLEDVALCSQVYMDMPSERTRLDLIRSLKIVRGYYG